MSQPKSNIWWKKSNNGKKTCTNATLDTKTQDVQSSTINHPPTTINQPPLLYAQEESDSSILKLITEADIANANNIGNDGE